MVMVFTSSRANFDRLQLRANQTSGRFLKANAERLLEYETGVVGLR